jgi:hypothetical protein
VDKLTYYKALLWLSLFISSLLVVHQVWPEIVVDHSLYGELLKKYVKDGVVNYQGFKNEESKLDKYLKVLEEPDSSNLSSDEQFAFYVNAYNAWTIKFILSKYPDINSIKELGSIFKSPWKKKIARIDGDIITLDDIEHGILRPRFQDSRVHFVVNCASKGCPPLRSEPYRGDILNRQLDMMTESFINHPERNYIEGDTLYVSQIFEWYKEDFPEGVISFFFKYAKGGLKRDLEEKKNNLKVKYLDYDWSLNGF